VTTRTPRTRGNREPAAARASNNADLMVTPETYTTHNRRAIGPPGPLRGTS
jgi:hypothetical protein